MDRLKIIVLWLIVTLVLSFGMDYFFGISIDTDYGWMLLYKFLHVVAGAILVIILFAGQQSSPS